MGEMVGRRGGGADHEIQSCIWWRYDGWLNRNDRTSHVHTATWLGWVPRQDELLRMCVGRAGTSTLFILKDEKWLRFSCNSHDPNIREQLNPSPVPSHTQVTCCSFGQSPVRSQTCSACSNCSLSAVNQPPFHLLHRLKRRFPFKQECSECKRLICRTSLVGWRLLAKIQARKSFFLGVFKLT